MEFGDIIYFILLVFFVILGFFNDSRKKKEQKQSQGRPHPEGDPHPFFSEEEELFPPQPTMNKPITTPPPAPFSRPADEGRREFRSSFDLVSIHDKTPPLSTYDFDYDANSFYEKDPDSPDIDASYHGTPEKTIQGSLHPLIKDLREDTGREELKKGLIYSEIIQRKY